MASESRYVREIVERRGRFEKHFVRADGQCEAVKLPHPIHYERHGRWHDYAPRWHERGGLFRLQGMDFDVEVDPVTARVDCADWSVTLIEPALTVMPTAVGRRLLWAAPEFDLYLLPHFDGLSAHAILRTASAPRAWRWRGDAPWSRVSGADNLDGLAERREVERNRWIEATCERAGDEIVATWSGRVKAMDASRRRHYSDEVAYPVRLRLS